MRLSEEKTQDLYAAISDAVMDLRIRISKKHTLDHENMDYNLFILQNKIWNNIHKTLNLEGPA